MSCALVQAARFTHTATKVATPRRLHRSAHRHRSRIAMSGVRIQRIETEDARMAQIVIHNGICYLSGQAELGDDITEQTNNTLAECDRLLQLAGTSKENLLTCMVWLKTMDDYAAFNAAYASWIDPRAKPTRACVKSDMALPEYLVEIQFTAAMPDGTRSTSNIV